MNVNSASQSAEREGKWVPECVRLRTMLTECSARVVGRCTMRCLSHVLQHLMYYSYSDLWITCIGHAAIHCEYGAYHAPQRANDACQIKMATSYACHIAPSTSEPLLLFFPFSASARLGRCVLVTAIYYCKYIFAR